LHEALPGRGFDTAAWRALDYITTQRDKQEHVILPPLNDHWAAYGLAEMSGWPGRGLSDANIAYARGLAGRFSLFIRFESQKPSSGWQLWLRGGVRSSAALGTWVEGQAALWRLSMADARMADLRSQILSSATCGAGILVRRQSPPSSGPHEAGAWFAQGITEMDDQQHASSGLTYTADGIEGRTQRAPDPWSPPSMGSSP
jgi:hypothetical protein